MAHPLYPVARKYVGKHVHVHHISGRVYQGVLHSCNRHGIYLLPVSYASYGGSDDMTALQAAPKDLDAREVYSPASFFAFGALSGLTLGALASRPPYYGGYGGYPGYGGYGYGGYPGYYW